MVLISQGVEEAERPDEGFYIRSGITVVLKNATIKDGTIIWNLDIWFLLRLEM